LQIQMRRDRLREPTNRQGALSWNHAAGERILGFHDYTKRAFVALSLIAINAR